MRKFCFLIGLLIIHSFLFSITGQRDILYSQTNHIALHEFSIFNSTSTNKRLFYIVNPQEVSPVKIIWIFHGYKPGTDPYRQDPKIFIRNWCLELLALKYHFQFILPDMGISLYPMTEWDQTNSISDILLLKNARLSYTSNYSNYSNLIMGVSTGVEGALKFASLFSNVPDVIALSGTYDLLRLPKESGEYQLHQNSLGTNESAWSNENPVCFLKNGKHMKLYLFCEEKSLFADQVNFLKSAGINNLEIEDLTSLGKGHRHNWDFWSSPRVTDKIQSILIK